MNPTWTSDCGTVKLWRGDCLEVMPTWGDGEVDAVVTDPPYGIGLTNHARGKERRNRDWTVLGDDSTDVSESALAWLANRRIATAAFASPSQPWSGRWRSRLVWHKHGLGMGGDRNVCWKSDWELIQVRDNGPLSGSRESAVLQGFDIRPDEFVFHPCQKPTALIEYLIAKLQSVHLADPFMGSGTTGVAAVRLGRKFYGVELDPDYFETAKRRIQDELNRFPLFEPKPDKQLALI